MEEGPGGYTTRSLFKVTLRDPTGLSSGGYLVPYGPAWRGIVFNSVVWGVVVWSVVVLPFSIRRARRRRRGLCLGCGYDLSGGGGDGGVVCPECGGEQREVRKGRKDHAEGAED